MSNCIDVYIFKYKKNTKYRRVLHHKMNVSKKRVSLKTPLLPREKYLLKPMAASVRGKTKISSKCKTLRKTKKTKWWTRRKACRKRATYWHQHGFLAVSGVFTLYTHSNAQYVRNETATCSWKDQYSSTWLVDAHVQQSFYVRWQDKQIFFKLAATTCYVLI